MMEQRILIDDLESTTGWTTGNGTLEIDPDGAFGRKGLKLTHTDEAKTSAYMRKVFTNGIETKGKYIRLWVNVHNAVAIKNIDISIYMDSYPTPLNYYNLNLYKDGFQSSGEYRGLVDGVQQLDFHLADAHYKGGDPDAFSKIKAIQINVVTADGSTGASATFSRLEMAVRKGYVVFVNDAPYNEFMKDVAPYLHSRKLPYTVQLTAEAIDHYLTSPETEPTGMVSLDELKRLNEKGLLHLGLHFAAFTEESDESFAEFVQEYGYKLQKLGFEADVLSGSFLTNNAINEVRWKKATSLSPVCRQAANIPNYAKSRVINKTIYGTGFHAVPSSPTTNLLSLPIHEFDDDGGKSSPEIVAEWVKFASEKQVGLHVFGHGTTRKQLEYRSPIETYESFFNAYDKYRNQLDWLTVGELYKKYENARPSLSERKTAFAY